MLTEQVISNLTGLAGTDFTWASTKSARPHSDIRTALKEFLWDYANGKCVFCNGDTTLESSQACHIVSSGGPKVRRGYVAGNLANGCGTCNAAHGERFDIVPLSEVARPDLVPMTWPSNVELRHRGRLLKAVRQAA